MSLPRLASTCPMCSDRSTRALPRVGSPIRKSSDQRMFSSSPRLIAAVHVLHRHLTPRHPPRALSILTDTCRAHLCAAMQFSRYALTRMERREVETKAAFACTAPSPAPHPPKGGPSRLNSMPSEPDPARTRTHTRSSKRNRAGHRMDQVVDVDLGLRLSRRPEGRARELDGTA